MVSLGKLYAQQCFLACFSCPPVLVYFLIDSFPIYSFLHVFYFFGTLCYCLFNGDLRPLSYADGSETFVLIIFFELSNWTAKYFYHTLGLSQWSSIRDLSHILMLSSKID